LAPPQVTVFAIVSFLFGIGAAGGGLAPGFAILPSLLAAGAIFAWKRAIVAAVLLPLACLAGVFYYHLYFAFRAAGVSMPLQAPALAATVFDRLKADGRPIPGDVKTNLAQVYFEQGRLDDAAALYRDLVTESPRSKTILRNAAMVADRRNAASEAADYWAKLAMLEEVATPTWYEARLSTARALLASKQAPAACKSVQEVEGFRPDLRDQPTKQKFSELAAKACNKPS